MKQLKFYLNKKNVKSSFRARERGGAVEWRACSFFQSTFHKNIDFFFSFENHLIIIINIIFSITIKYRVHMFF